jgi:hypothetical protein
VDDERYFAEHSVSGLLRGDHTSRASYYVSALQNGWMTINEVRELENLNPIDGGDVHFVPMNMQTLEQMTEEPEPAQSQSRRSRQSRRLSQNQSRRPSSSIP